MFLFCCIITHSKKVLHNKKNIHFVRSRSMPSARSEARFKVRRLNSTTKVNEKNFFTKRTAARGRVQFEQCWRRDVAEYTETNSTKRQTHTMNFMMVCGGEAFVQYHLIVYLSLAVLCLLSVMVFQSTWNSTQNV